MSWDIPDYVCTIKGYKKKKLRDLTIEDKLDIVDDVMVKKDYHENICAWYGIDRESIKSLLKNIKKDASYLRKLETKRATKQRQKDNIQESIERIMDKDKFIQSAREVQGDIVANGDQIVSYSSVCQYLKNDTGLKFKKQKKVPQHANSLRNQYMRQQFAIKMLQLL